MKKIIFIMCIIFTISYIFDSSYGYSSEKDTTQKIISQADELIKKRKYESAFKILMDYDKNSEVPEIVIKKVEIVTQYFVKSIDHLLFTLKDLDVNEDLMELRGQGTGEFSVYAFDIPLVLEGLIKKYPDNYKLVMCLGIYYYELSWRYPLKNVEPSVYQSYLIKAYEKGEYDYKTVTYIADSYFRSNNYNEAVVYYLRSLKLNPNFPPSNYNVALIYFKQKEFNKAIPYAKKALIMYGDPEYNKGEAALFTKEYQADTNRLLGFLYIKLEDYNEAYKYLRESTPIRPEYNNIKLIFELEMKLNKINEAKKTRITLYELDPKNLNVYEDLISIYKYYNELDDLLSFFKTNITKYEKDNEICGDLYFFIAEIYSLKKSKELGKQNYEAARKYFSKVFKSDHNVFKIIDTCIKRLE